MKTQNMRAFTITYLPYTNFLPSRIKIRDERHRKTVVISYDLYKGQHGYEQAANFLKEKGIETTFTAEIGKGMLLLTDNFKTQIK